MNNTYATFRDPAMAEKAAGALLDHGIKPEHISIVLPEAYGNAYKANADGGTKSEHMAKQGITTTTPADAASGSAKGAGVGLVAGAVAALAAVFIPGVGLVLGGGALALALGGMAGTTVAGAIAGGATGYLRDQGMPPEKVEEYSSVLGTGGAIVTVSPVDEKVDNATIEEMLRKYDGNVSSYAHRTPTRM